MRKADYTKTGILSHIQKFSVNDGPGIRTVVFFKGCPLRCLWCANPESQSPRPQILWEEKKCADCRHCIDICPARAVTLRSGHIHIDHAACTGCKKCAAECPKRALTPEGEKKSVKEVMDIVLQDLPFYEESGGGITLSGGEFLSQPAFAKELLCAAKENGLHTCGETTGFAAPEVFDEVTAQIDCLLFDLKHWDSEKHRAGTGVTNELPLSNMRRAIAGGKEVLPRIPVIPGFNDSLKDAARLADTLAKYAGAEKCQLLPFHQFGENKYRLLDQPYALEDVPSLHREELGDYLQVFLDCGIDAYF